MAIEGSGPPLPRKKEMKIYAAVQRICVVVQVWMTRLANSAHKHRRWVTGHMQASPLCT